jgi:hypothetical protein
MDALTPWIPAAVACIAAGAVAWAAARWWYGRNIVAGKTHIAKLEKARQFAEHQTGQARKQVERLQKELATAQRQASAPQPAKPATTAAQRAAAAETALAAAASPATRAAPGRPAPAALPANGFADTQPME